MRRRYARKMLLGRQITKKDVNANALEKKLHKKDAIKAKVVKNIDIKKTVKANCFNQRFSRKIW